MKIFLSLLLIASFCEQNFASTTEDFENGCQTIKKGDQFWRNDIFSRFFPLMGSNIHLNCSGSKWERFVPSAYNKSINTIYFYYDQIEEFFIDDLENYTTISKIEFRMKKLVRLIPSSKNLTLGAVSDIVFAHTQLSSIPNEALKSFPNVMHFTMLRNPIREMGDDDFINNPKITSLELININFLMPFNGKFLKNLNLYAIYIVGSNLDKIPEEINGQSIATLDLSYNQITEIKNNTFKNNTFLTWITLSGNQISNIEVDAFKDASSVISLELSDNKITTMSDGTFDSLISKKAMMIELYENPINCSCNLQWFKRLEEGLVYYDINTEIRYKCFHPSHLHGFRNQQLVSSNFTCNAGDKPYTDCNTKTEPNKQKVKPKVPNRPLRPVQSKKVCPARCTCYDRYGKIYSGDDSKSHKILSRFWERKINPRVECIEAGYTKIPSNLPKDIRCLVMQWNNISVFNVSDLKTFYQLSVLNLKKNQIKFLIPNKKVEMKRLQTLHLQGNNITNISSIFLKSFPNLITFSINRNFISKYPSNLFNSNKDLTRLYIGSNRITNFNGDILQSLSLKALSLRDLKIKKVPESIKSMNNLYYIDLSDNKITEIVNGTFQHLSNLWKIDLENNLINKLEENAFNGAIKLKTILLSENKIQTLPTNVFSNLSLDGLNVELWENPFNCNCSMKGFKQWLEARIIGDPTTEIRFRCLKPYKNRQMTSDYLVKDDFTCDPEDSLSDPIIDCLYPCPSHKGQLAAAVILTFITTLIACYLLLRVCFRAKYGHLLRYIRQKNYEEGGILPDEEF